MAGATSCCTADGVGAAARADDVPAFWAVHVATGEGCSPNSKNCTCQWDIQNPLWHHGGSRAYPQSVAPASSFNPVDLDTNNWMEAALQLGASQVCLTVRHVDGFAL